MNHLEQGRVEADRGAKAGFLLLGSGSGKNAFICSQIVGASGRVTGVDRNADMLALSRQAIPVVASAVGFDNVRFVDGAMYLHPAQI